MFEGDGELWLAPPDANMGLAPGPVGDMFEFFGDELEEPVWCTGEDLTCAPGVLEPLPLLPPDPESENFLLSPVPLLLLLLFVTLVGFFDFSRPP